MTWQIDSGYFCAGLVSQYGTVARAAPIIKYMRGWSIQRVADYCARKGWKLNICEEKP